MEEYLNDIIYRSGFVCVLIQYTPSLIEGASVGGRLDVGVVKDDVRRSRYVLVFSPLEIFNVEYFDSVVPRRLGGLGQVFYSIKLNLLPAHNDGDRFIPHSALIVYLKRVGGFKVDIIDASLVALARKVYGLVCFCVCCRARPLPCKEVPCMKFLKLSKSSVRGPMKYNQRLSIFA